MIGLITRRPLFVQSAQVPSWLGAVLGVAFAAAAIAQPTAARAQIGAELLNSQRIEQAFGSYGIEVLESDETIRVSNLYSIEAKGEICRTFAVVRYPDRIDPLFSTEHRLILDGGSIGAVFTARGWKVEKFHRHYGEVPATNKVARLMRTASSSRLAVHVYALEVSKADARFQYAMIVEVHHPDYLSSAELAEIYGPVVMTAEDHATAELLAIAADKMAR